MFLYGTFGYKDFPRNLFYTFSLQKQLQDFCLSLSQCVFRRNTVDIGLILKPGAIQLFPVLDQNKENQKTGNKNQYFCKSGLPPGRNDMNG
jgi:hypothetical protein